MILILFWLYKIKCWPSKESSRQGQAFASVRGRTRKAEAPNPEGEPKEKEVFKAYPKQVEKGSFWEDVFRRSEFTKDWGSARSMNEGYRNPVLDNRNLGEL